MLAVDGYLDFGGLAMLAFCRTWRHRGLSRGLSLLVSDGPGGSYSPRIENYSVEIGGPRTVTDRYETVECMLLELTLGLLTVTDRYAPLRGPNLSEILLDIYV